MKAKNAALAALLGTCLLGYQGSARAANDSFLLFPYVSGIDNGGETLIYIMNTSADPLGTTQQSGECALWFYGSNAPPTYVLTSTIAAGASYDAFATNLTTNFFGYMIAACNFPYAHGLAILMANGNYFSTYMPLSIVTPRPATEENLNN
jgi:hypothetical protein